MDDNKIEEPQVLEEIKKEVPKNRHLLIATALFLIGIVLILAIYFSSFYNKENIIDVPKITPTPTPSIFIEPSQEITLIKDQRQNISDTNIFLTLTELENPQNCMDCETRATIKAENNSEEKSLNYVCGGFTGECTSSLDAFGIKLQLKEIIGQDKVIFKIL